MNRPSSHLLAAACLLLGAARGYAESAVTIYNQSFAVVRDELDLDLKQGVNEVTVNDITAHVEPDSVILRDPSGKRSLQILEQNYRADPITEGLLLSLYEGKEISFLAGTNVVKGKIIRAGYVPHASGMIRYGQDYQMRQSAFASYQGGGQPIIEVDGQLRFSLPGQPLYPALTDDTILKPTLQWLVEADTKGKLKAELAYVTGGMAWKADYNMISLDKGDALEVVGWVTMDNQSGKTFRNTRIKLMAGNVNKMASEDSRVAYMRSNESAGARGGMQPAVSEKAFDEYHLYTLDRATTLRDRETKQVEFVRSGKVKAERLYVYDGAAIDASRYRGYSVENIRQDRDYGTRCNPKVWVMREFKNTQENHLGIPLPAGHMRFYTRDDDGRLEFTGENTIDHTPKNELVRVYTGDAFDLRGSRTRTDYKLDTQRSWCDETFEIKLRNQKEKEAVEVRVAECLYRGVNWEIVEKTHTYLKTESQKMEFRVQLAPGEEAVIKYKVHYTW